jgi:hypothetical protein
MGAPYELVVRTVYIAHRCAQEKIRKLSVYKAYPLSSTNSDSEGGFGIRTIGLRGERLTRYVRRNHPEQGAADSNLQETY